MNIYERISEAYESKLPLIGKIVESNCIEFLTLVFAKSNQVNLYCEDLSILLDEKIQLELQNFLGRANTNLVIILKNFDNKIKFGKEYVNIIDKDNVEIRYIPSKYRYQNRIKSFITSDSEIYCELEGKYLTYKFNNRTTVNTFKLLKYLSKLYRKNRD